ncbi:ferritin family protein [Thermococcus sp.]|uniref:ferritin-like domain-containing protein n=1 Tax=Thermococcus sp. TaxID=35749 RepID=UPI00263950E6|nr:ferritin family protein [Thermococcus sp.]
MPEFSENERSRLQEMILSLSRLDGRSLLSYWITSEIEVAKTYNDLAKRVMEYGWDPRIPRLFQELARESLEHAEILLEEYRRTYDNAPLIKPGIPSIRIEFSLEKLKNYLRNGRLVDLVAVLMESEELASEVYRYLTENSNGSSTEMFRRLADNENDRYLRLKTLMDYLQGG